MMKRRAFGVAGLSAVALAAVEGTALGQKDRKERTEHGVGHHKMLEECAEACSECQQACDRCATHCAHLLADGHKEHLTTLLTCQDCADVCAAAAQIVSRGGPFASLVCDACAEACARCAKECDKVASDDMMKQCAEECRECEKACRDMPKHAGQGAK